MKALERIGVADTLRSECMPLDRVALCRDTGSVLKQFAFDECKGGEPELLGVERRRLQQLLYEAVSPERVILDATVASVALDGPRPTVMLHDGRSLQCRLLVGADGVRSVVARSLGLPPTSFVGQGGYRGIARFQGNAPVATRTVCQIWGKGHRAGLYPMSDTTAYWFVTFDCDDVAVDMDRRVMKADALRIVRGWRHGIEECIEATSEDEVSRSRFYDRWPLPFGRAAAGNATLAGDSLHPMTPNLGQGGCTALEDGVVLARKLRACWASGDDAALQAALAAYERERAARCLKLAVRSRLIGAVLQSALPPVVFARDVAVAKLLDAGHFFDHALWDCGDLE